MELKQSFTVNHPPDQVWRFFRNVVAVAECMPGASLTEAPTDDHVKGEMKVKVGPIAAAFAGEADLERDDAKRSGTIRGSGRDKKSGTRTKGAVSYALSEENGATKVDISVEFTLAGSLAQFSRGGIVNDLATRLTAEFAERLQAKLDTAAPEKRADEPAPSAPDQLDAGGLLFSVIWGRIKNFFAAMFGNRQM